ncbi:MAG: tetratricopeptide repeat protein, partial [Catalinimonas sp.]
MLRWLIIGGIMVLTAGCEPPRRDGERVRDVPLTTEEQLEARRRALTDAIDEDPRADYFYQRAELSRELKDPAAALEDLQQAVALDSSRVRYHVALARAYRDVEQIPAALRAAREAERLGSEDPTLYLTLGEIYLILREYQRSLGYLNQALQLAPFGPAGYYYKGLVYAETGDTAQAVSSLQTALEQDNTYADAYSTLASIHLATGDYRTALLYLDAGRRFTPDDAFVPYNQGVAYEGLGRADTAETFYEQAVALDSTLDLAWYNLGAMYLNRRDYPTAARYFQRVVDVRPQRADGHYWLAYAARRNGDLTTAETHFERTTELGGRFA